VRLLFPLLRVLIAFGVIGTLLFYIDRTSLLNRLENLSPFHSAAAIVLGLVQILLVGSRWSLLTRLFSEGPAVLRLRDAQTINYSSQFVGQMLPFLAADALRIVYARAAGMSLKSAVLSTAFDRGIALLLLVGLCLVGMIISPSIGRLPGLRSTIIPLAAIGFFGCIFALAFSERLAQLSYSNRIVRGSIELLGSFRPLFRNGRVFAEVALLGLLVHALSIAIFWMMCLGYDVAISARDVVTIVPVLLLGTAVPIGVAGWGIREGLAVVLFAAVGIDAEAALAVSLSFGAMILVAALPGAVTLVMLSVYPRGEPAPPES
jgi:uncharacterized protein (TIRG00374 family)